MRANRNCKLFVIFINEELAVSCVKRFDQNDRNHKNSIFWTSKLVHCAMELVNSFRKLYRVMHFNICSCNNKHSFGPSCATSFIFLCITHEWRKLLFYYVDRFMVSTFVVILCLFPQPFPLIILTMFTFCRFHKMKKKKNCD